MTAGSGPSQSRHVTENRGCSRLDERIDRAARQIEFKRIETDHTLRELEQGEVNDPLPDGNGVAAFACAVIDDVRSVADRLIDEGFACHAIGTETTVALVSGDEDAQIAARARRFADACRGEKDDPLCALGRVVNRDSDPSIGFNEARKALDFAVHRGMKGVVCYDDVKRRLLPGQRLGDWREIGRMVLIAHSSEVEERIRANIDKVIRSTSIGFPERRLRIESMPALVSSSLPPEAHEIRKRVAAVVGRVETWPLMSMLRDRLVETLLEIAEAVGYTDVKYFMRVFKQFAGITANEFRTRTTQ